MGIVLRSRVSQSVATARRVFVECIRVNVIAISCKPWSLEEVPMHLASDYIHPYKSAGARRAQCRIRIYLSDDMRAAPVVVCSELPNNPGSSITNSAQVIAAGVIQANSMRHQRWP